MFITSSNVKLLLDDVNSISSPFIIKTVLLGIFGLEFCPETIIGNLIEFKLSLYEYSKYKEF